MLTTALLLLILATLIGGCVLILVMLRRRADDEKTPDTGFTLLQNQINELTRTLDLKLGESQRAAHEQFGESSKIIREITTELTRVNESQKQVVDIKEQLRNLQDILKNPKQRGVLGEYYLEVVLENVLPAGSYQMQYAFKDGSIVDAVVFAKKRIIPIDSKFSLENYNRLIAARDDVERARFEDALRNDLKLRIDETSKYIKPEENTMDFAFMFIPSEAIYYDLLVNKVGSSKTTMRDLIEYATQDKKVIIVSPTSFLAYLQTVLQGLKALQIEESAKEIRKRVEELGRHLIHFEEYVKKIGTHLGSTVHAYNAAGKEFRKIDKDVLRLTGEGLSVDTPALESPKAEEYDE